MNNSTRTLISLAVMAALGLSACELKDTAGTTATEGNLAKSAYVTSGAITGFGSVFINGVEFETDTTQFTVDDAEGVESQLKIGMYITLEGDVNADGTSGKAASISFDADVEGMVLANNISAGVGTLDVMGQTVNVDLDTKFESNVDGITSIDGIQLNNIVEVSGYSSGNGNIYATRVELKKAAHDGDEVELKGEIAGLADTTFMIGGMTVDFGSAQLDDFDGLELANGMYVKVKSSRGIDNAGHLVASKIKLKGKDGKGKKRGDGEEMEIEGVITAAIDSDNSFVEVNGQKVMLAEDTELDNGSLADLLAGKKVEVEGEFDSDGNFIAKEIKFRAEAKIKMEGTLEAVDMEANTVTMFGQKLTINTLTVMDDEQDKNGVEPVKYFNLSHLQVGDWLELKAYQDENGNLVASKLVRDDLEAQDSGLIEVKLEGSIDEVKATGELVVAGVTVDVQAVAADKTFSAGMKIEMKGTFADDLFSASEVSVEEAESED